MTVQEAIELHLKPLKERAFAHTTETALTMAIESMEEVEQYRALGTVEELKEAMENQPKTDWIPCEERLPSESGKYLVTEIVRTALRKYYTVGSSYFNGETWHSDFKGKFGGKDIGRTVIAWQPLPQPYKKEGAE